MFNSTIYSIGHSDHTIEDFVALLQKHAVEGLADVRSQPYSRWVPQFNRETLQWEVEAAGLQYVWLGDTLGGRPPDRALYDSGSDRPNYDRMREDPTYLIGIDQLLALAGQSTVAMMCSEGDYAHCHRTLLITPTLLRRDVRVIHILPDGRTIEATEQPKQLALF
jgi:uncharacterized protein (DUF488 family)